MEQIKTHWKTQFNYEYLGSYSLPGGMDIILTIRSMEKKIVKGDGGKEDVCLIAHFAEAVKPMVINKTNCKTLEKLFKSPNIEDWKGKQIQVGSSRVSAFGDTVDALRVRPFIPKPISADGRQSVETGSPVWKNIVDALAGGHTMEAVEKRFKLTDKQKTELKKHEIN